jgi:putative FmdB family regulatory protein
MPLYEYECDACAHRFERIQKFSDPLADTCPACGGTVRKLLSSPAIQFKGSGWYINDYPKKSGGGGGSDSSSSSGSKSDGDKKDKKSESSDKSSKSSEASESKPATTPAPAKSE